MRVFLTGGTGLVGSHVAERLARRGDGVVALVRPGSDTAFLESVGAELVAGDMLDDAPVQAERMAGCDALVHAGAKVFERGGTEAFRRVNVDGTDRVLRGAARAGVLRVVHVSSIAVYGNRVGGRVTEADWHDAEVPPGAAYAHSKHASESRAWRLHRDGAVRLTTVRPAVVYGERDRAAVRVLARLTALPAVPLLAGGRTAAPVVYAGNVARGITAALDRDSSIGRAYNLALDLPVTLRALVEGFGDAIGRRVRVIAVPPAPAALAARALDVLTAALPGVGRTRAHRAMRLLSRDNPYDSSRARLELGWSALVPHDVALRRTGRWYRAQHE